MFDWNLFLMFNWKSLNPVLAFMYSAHSAQFQINLFIFCFANFFMYFSMYFSMYISILFLVFSCISLGISQCISLCISLHVFCSQCAVSDKPFNFMLRQFLHVFLYVFLYVSFVISCLFLYFFMYFSKYFSMYFFMYSAHSAQFQINLFIFCLANFFTPITRQGCSILQLQMDFRFLRNSEAKFITLVSHRVDCCSNKTFSKGFWSA